MTSITQILPPETIDQIIDAIADNDNEDEMQYPFEMRDVKACSLTCKIFAICCRRRIYRSVRLYDTPERDDLVEISYRPFPLLASSFAKLIRKKPEIADHVRELIYVMPSTIDDDPVLVHWELQRLHKLQKISLRSESGLIDWHEIVRSASWPLILGLMACPTVTRVELRTVGRFNISDLGTRENLKALILDGDCSLSEGNAAVLPPCPPSGPLKLQQLTISPFKSILTTLLTRRYADNTPIIDRSELRQVTINMFDDTDYAIQIAVDFLDLTSNLTDLRLIEVLEQTSGRTHASVYVPRFLVEPLKTLKNLTLELSVDTMLPRESRNFPDVPKVLNSISAKNSIETLTLKIDVFNYDPLPQDHWETIKKCVIHLEWPVLTRVDLKMSTVIANCRSVDGPVTFIRLPTSKCLVEAPYIRP